MVKSKLPAETQIIIVQREPVSDTNPAPNALLPRYPHCTKLLLPGREAPGAKHPIGRARQAKLPEEQDLLCAGAINHSEMPIVASAGSSKVNAPTEALGTLARKPHVLKPTKLILRAGLET